MPTVYKRLVHYCHIRKCAELPLDQKQVLGEIVRRNYFPSEPADKLPPHDLIQQQEPEGEFKVISYPRSFIPTIDKLINGFYATLKPSAAPPPKRERKRIPITSPIKS